MASLPLLWGRLWHVGVAVCRVPSRSSRVFPLVVEAIADPVPRKRRMRLMAGSVMGPSPAGGCGCAAGGGPRPRRHDGPSVDSSDEGL